MKLEVANTFTADTWTAVSFANKDSYVESIHVSTNATDEVIISARMIITDSSEVQTSYVLFEDLHVIKGLTIQLIENKLGYPSGAALEIKSNIEDGLSAFITTTEV